MTGMKLNVLPFEAPGHNSRDMVCTNKVAYILQVYMCMAQGKYSLLDTTASSQDVRLAVQGKQTKAANVTKKVKLKTTLC